MPSKPKSFSEWLNGEIAKLDKKLAKGPQSGYPALATKCNTLEIVRKQWKRRPSPGMVVTELREWLVKKRDFEGYRDGYSVAIRDTIRALDAIEEETDGD